MHACWGNGWGVIFVCTTALLSRAGPPYLRYSTTVFVICMFVCMSVCTYRYRQLSTPQQYNTYHIYYMQLRYGCPYIDVWCEQGTRQLTDFSVCNRVQLIELKYCYRTCCCADPYNHRRHWFTGIVAHASGSAWFLHPIKPHRMYLHFSTQSTPIHHPSIHPG